MSFRTSLVPVMVRFLVRDESLPSTESRGTLKSSREQFEVLLKQFGRPSDSGRMR